MGQPDKKFYFFQKMKTPNPSPGYGSDIPSPLFQNPGKTSFGCIDSIGVFMPNESIFCVGVEMQFEVNDFVQDI